MNDHKKDLELSHSQFWAHYHKQFYQEFSHPDGVMFSHASLNFMGKNRVVPRCAEDLDALLFLWEEYGENVSDFNVIMNALFFGRTRRQGLLMMRRFVEKVADDEIMSSLPAEWQAKMICVRQWSVELGRVNTQAEANRSASRG